MKVITRHYEPALITIFRLADAMVAGLIFYFSSFLFQYPETNIIETSIIIFLLTMIVFTYAGAYRSWRLSSITGEIKTLAQSCVIVFVLFYMFITFIHHLRFFLHNHLLLWLITWLFVLCIERVFVRSFLRYYRRKGRNTKRAVIVGTGKIGERLARWIHENPWSGTKIEGFFNGKLEETIEGYPIVGSYDDVPEFVRSNNIDIVYIALPMSHSYKMKWLFQELGNSTASVYLAPDIFLTDFIRCANVRYIDSMPILSLVDTPICGLNTAIKRIEDIVCATLILILVSPLLVIISSLIKLISEGPVLFKQWRYGLDGKPILVWKFRTMTVCEDGYKFKQATKDDPRITRIGVFLRKTSLDELPQFFNVLQGRMSVVGPRPHAINMNEKYRKEIQGYMIRHKIKPGITGLAQLNGFRGETDSEEKIKMRTYYDLRYIQEWSVWEDIWIMLVTPFKIMKIKNVY